MNSLTWIDKDKLQDIIRGTLQRAQEANSQAQARMRKNVIDPFSSLVIATTTDINTKADLVAVQQGNSVSSGIASAIGAFHQQIPGSIKGFKNHNAGYDLECPGRNILAEVKNKHNTMNASNHQKVVADLDTAVRQKAGNRVGYLVIIIPAKPERYKTKLTKREVYETDGASFYELATGSSSALHDLYDAFEDITTNHYPKWSSKDILKYCKKALREGIPA